MFLNVSPSYSFAWDIHSKSNNRKTSCNMDIFLEETWGLNYSIFAIPEKPFVQIVL